MVRRCRAETQARTDGAVLDYNSVHSEEHHCGQCLKPVARDTLARQRQHLLLDEFGSQLFAR
jgi:hypothetical protein